MQVISGLIWKRTVEKSTANSVSATLRMKDMFEARTQLDVAQGMDPDRVAVSKDAQSRR